MFRRQQAIVLPLSLTVALLTAGCEDEEKATPQVIFDGRLEQGSGNNCRDSGGLFTVGDFGNVALDVKLRPAPVKDGESFGQGAVSVSCSVVPVGTNEFQVNASVNLSGATGGLFRIDGKFAATGEQTNIRGFFSSRASGNTYDQKDRQCVVRYTTPTMGVAAGRVWGEITCPSAEDTDADTTCTAVAQFRFENCAQ